MPPGLSVGAFYVYFESKEIFYASLISSGGREVRSFISSNLAKGPGDQDSTAWNGNSGGSGSFWPIFPVDRYCYAIVGKQNSYFLMPYGIIMRPL
jgi:hypothetical protein